MFFQNVTHSFATCCKLLIEPLAFALNAGHQQTELAKGADVGWLDSLHAHQLKKITRLEILFSKAKHDQVQTFHGGFEGALAAFPPESLSIWRRKP